MKKALLMLFALMSVLGVKANETVDLYFTEYGNVSMNYYSDPGDWYFGFVDDENNYIVRLDCLTSEDSKYGTYTLNDLIPEYSYIQDFTVGEEAVDHQYLEGTEVTLSEEDYTMYITGQLVCDNGVTYVLHGDIALPRPQTYDIEATELNRIQYYEEDQDWLVAFSSDNFKIRLDLSSPTGAFAGTYTQDDIYGETYVEDLYEYDTDYLASLNVTMSMPEGCDDPNVACEVTGTGVGMSGNTYNFHFRLDPPVQPKEVKDVDVNVDSAAWPSIYGGGYYELTEKDNADEHWTLQYWNLTGEYKENGLNLQESKRYNSATGEEQTVLHGTVSQTFDSEANKVIAKAELVMSDTIQYNIQFETPVETKGEYSYNFTNLNFDNTYADEGFQEITASNSEASIDVNLNNFAQVPGTYDDKTCSISLTTKDEDGYDKYISTITVTEASTTIDEDGNVVFKARMLGQDGNDINVYNIDACFVMPEIEDTLTITIDNAVITDYTENGYEPEFYISGSTSDAMTTLWMGVASTQIPGHYTTENISNGSALTFWDEYWNSTEARFYAADFDVTKDGRNVTLTGDFQAGSHLVHLTVTGKTSVEGAVDGDNEDEGIDLSFTASELASFSPSSDGVVVDLKNAERNDICRIIFYLEDNDGETIPEGEYSVTKWGEVPGVAAGDNWYGELSGSFYGTFADENYLNTPMWFLEYGTVTVSRNDGELAFEVNGQNSYYQPFHVCYNMPGQGIENVAADSIKALKYIKDGKLVISKAGQEYNAIGQQTK